MIIKTAKHPSFTASLLEGAHCADCGWPIVDAVCNDNFLDGVKDDDPYHDWWYYCTNKGCKNHEGEGVWQETPEWVVNV